VGADAVAEPDHLCDEVIPRKVGEVIIHVSLPTWFASRVNNSQMRRKSFIGPEGLLTPRERALRGYLDNAPAGAH
jgi:hypothetical protein